MVLTSDNVVRLYLVENSEAVSVGVFPVGRQPQGFIGGSRSSFLDVFGDTAVDFDFGAAEVAPEDEEVVVTQQVQTTVFSKGVGDGNGDSQLVFVRSGSTMVVRGE